MYTIKSSGKFRKEFKKICKTKNFEIKVFSSIIDTLLHDKRLAEKYKNHQLQGKFKGRSECHLKPNILLIYKIDKEESSLYLLRIGSHSDLFG